MNIKDMLRLLIMNDNLCRQKGRSTVLKEAADKINGMFICNTDSQAKLHGGIILSETKLRGNNKPIVLDHYVQSSIFAECLTRIINLEKKLIRIKEVVCTE